jgi:hypothetical protein
MVVNATVVDDAIRFVAGHQNQNKNKDKDKKNDKRKSITNKYAKDTLLQPIYTLSS